MTLQRGAFNYHSPTLKFCLMRPILNRLNSRGFLPVLSAARVFICTFQKVDLIGHDNYSVFNNKHLYITLDLPGHLFLRLF